MNRLIFDDCLAGLGDLPSASIHLIYLDPPFNTNVRRVGRGRSNGQANGRAHRPKVLSGGVAPTASYDDSFGSPADYIAYMRPRVEHMRRVLTPNGSLFFHCDWRMSHHVRLLLDEIFLTPPLSPLPSRGGVGGGVFVNEIIWRYGLGAARARRRLLTKHDVIFWYANSRHYTFNLIREAPTEAMLAKYRHTDEDGSRYMMSYGKRYALKGGKPLDDVWEIPAIAPTSSERVGYPTQKPLALLKRIITLASNEGDVVLDPFCGSGTTLVAAQQLGRRWIGMDVNPQAVAIAKLRMKN